MDYIVTMNNDYIVKIILNGEWTETSIEEEIFDNELSEYRVANREELKDRILDSISEASGNSRELMKDDYEYLTSLDDTFVFESTLTNDYIAKSDDESTFNEICEDILNINADLLNKRLKD